MDIKKCFEPNCMNEVEYACQCTSPEVYSCKLHALKHIETPEKTHTCEFIFVDSCKGTKEALIGFLEKEKSKHYKLKSRIAASFSNNLLNSEKELDELLNNLNSSSYVVNSYLSKISEVNRVNRSNQDPILGLLRLQPNEAVEKIKTMIPSNSDNYDSAKLFCRFSEKFEKMIEYFFRDKFEAYLDKRLINIENTLEEHKKSISLANKKLKKVKDSIIGLINENQKSLNEFETWKEAIDLKIENKTNMLISDIARITENLECNLAKKAENAITIDTSRKKSPEIIRKDNSFIAETDFKKPSLSSESNPSALDVPVKRYSIDHDCIYIKDKCLYNITYKNNSTNLLKYDPLAEKKEIIVLDTLKLDIGTSIAQLPDNKLFFYGGGNPISGITVILNRKKIDQASSSGTSCKYSSCIYFNHNVYCFGGLNAKNKALTLSSKFDLITYQWIKLTPMPNADAFCHSLVFNGNILISGINNWNLWRFSINNNNFTIIPFPYEFAKMKRKILVNADERLYLIECGGGSVYESEINSDAVWKRIAESGICSHRTWQVSCLCNNGCIYIGANINDIRDSVIEYYKFDLQEKIFY